MDPSDLTARLPVELLSRVLDFLDLDALALLRGPGHVSRRWRTIARAHRSFSRVIHVFESSCFDLFIEQLDAGSAGQTSLELRITAVKDVASFLNHILNNMHRCTVFKLTHKASVADMIPVFEMLCACTAPRLRRLSLRLTTPDPASESIDLCSNDLFGRNAPLLKELECTSWIFSIFSSDSLVADLSQVTLLILISACDAPLDQVLSVLPNLNTLMLRAGRSHPRPISNADALSNHKINRLWLTSLSEEWTPTIAAFNLPRITNILLEVSGLSNIAEQEVWNRYAAALVGPLKLEYLECTRSFQFSRYASHITFGTSGAPRRALHLICLPRFTAARATAAAALAAHPRVETAGIATLEVCTRFWTRVHGILAIFPGLKEIVLRIHEHDEEISPSHSGQRLGCPVLDELVLRRCEHASPGCLRIAPDHVANFLDTRISVARPPALTVRRPLVLCGDRTSLAKRVTRIVEL